MTNSSDDSSNNQSNDDRTNTTTNGQSHPEAEINSTSDAVDGGDERRFDDLDSMTKYQYGTTEALSADK